MNQRLDIQKTYKIYIGGQFPRTESGRYYKLNDKKGNLIADICLSSRKDFRNAAVAARNAATGWAGKTAFNRSQILYRIAELMEGRKSQFAAELVLQGSTNAAAENEVTIAIDRMVYYAGWCDKYQQIFSSVNPVSSSHFNFSVPEPMGVIAAIAPEDTGLLGLVTTIAPVIAGGNVCIVLASESRPLCAVTFAEVVNSSDVPAGVVNILTGNANELYTHFASHMDVNALVTYRNNRDELKTIKELASLNVKRVFVYDAAKETSGPYFIADLQEIKTTWHPVENIAAAKSGY